MTNGLIKVDRVRTVSEAIAIEKLGAGLIGVALDADPRFTDERTISVELAAEIGKSLSSARLVATLDFEWDPHRALRMAELAGGDLVQAITGAIPTPTARTALSRAGVGIVYAGIEVAHDDDPSWIPSRYFDTPDLNAALFQVEVLPENQNSWEFLRSKSPEYAAEFQIEDLNQFGRTCPLVAGFDFTPQNVAAVAAALPGIQGIALTLADNATRDALHFIQYDAARSAATGPGCRGSPAVGAEQCGLDGTSATSRPASTRRSAE